MDDFAFSPTDGLKNATSFPTTPTSNAAARKQFQDVLDQIKTYLNSTLLDGLESTTDSSSGADQIGATAISGLTGATVQALLEALKSTLDTHENDSAKYAVFTRTAAQGLTSGTDTQVVWQSKSSFNSEDFCEIDATTGQIKILQKGIYEITVNFQYASSATGNRVVNILTAAREVTPAATGGSATYLSATGFLQADVNALISILANQSSGGALDLQFQNTSCRIRQVIRVP